VFKVYINLDFVNILKYVSTKQLEKYRYIIVLSYTVSNIVILVILVVIIFINT